MKTLISNFSKQITEAINIGRSARFSAGIKISNVLISGLGGSGIGGSIISQLVEKDAAVPVNVNKDYFIPGYVNQNTLAIICSYSGNTEETLNAMQNCFENNAKTVCITSGGEALTLAK